MASPGSGHAGWNLPRCPRAPRCRPRTMSRTTRESPGTLRQARSRALTGALLLAARRATYGSSPTGAPMAALLGRLIAAQRAGQAAAGIPLGDLARLRRAFAAGRPRLIPPLRTIEPLTKRELEVLRVLAAGRSNQAIAANWWHPGHRQKAREPRPGQARRGRSHRGRHAGPRTEPHPLTRRPSHRRAADSGTRVPGANAGPGCTLVPGAPRKIPPGMSTFGGRLARRIFLACGRTECTPEGGSAMATVKPDPSNGGTALTRTAPALAS